MLVKWYCRKCLKHSEHEAGVTPRLCATPGCPGDMVKSRIRGAKGALQGPVK